MLAIKATIFPSSVILLSKYDELFKFLEPLPLGLNVYAGIISIVAPYSGNISPFVCHLSRTKCVMTIMERWWLQNPFNSIHAIALANLGEQASGM